MEKQATIEKYFKLLETFETSAAAFEDILHGEFTQHEFPNALNQNGQTSSREEIFKRMAMGKTLLQSQTYEIKSQAVQGDLSYVEALWTGVLAMDAGSLKKGQTLVAHFCIALEFRDGKIFRQRNYDCFEPFV